MGFWGKKKQEEEPTSGPSELPLLDGIGNEEDGDGEEMQIAIEPDEGEVPDDALHQCAPHMHRFDGEHTLWESSTEFSALSFCNFWDFWSWGEDIIVVTNMRVFLCQIRINPFLGWLTCFKPYYSSTIMRRRDISTISLRRTIRFPTAFYALLFIWFFASAYILSFRFVSPAVDVDTPSWVENFWALFGISLGFLILVLMFFSNDWVVTMSHKTSKMHPLSKSEVSARVSGPHMIGQLEEAVRAGYVGGGGWLKDEKKTKKTGKGYVATRQLSILEIAENGGGFMDPDLVDSADEDEEVLTPAILPVHKRLLPGEKLVYRCKHTARVLFFSIGNNSIAVTNKRIIIKKARYPLLCTRYPWLSRYFYTSIPLPSLHTIQHARIRLFGRGRFIAALLMFHITLLYMWFHLNYKACPEHKYCISWFPKPPDLLLEIPTIGVLAAPGLFLVLSILFQFHRGWGLVLDVYEKSHLNIEELRIGLSGPSQMNAVEDACRMGTVAKRYPHRPDGHLIPGEKIVGELECDNGKVRVTTKRLLVCRNHVEETTFVRKWITFWFRDYHVGSFDARDVAACSTRWIHLHSQVVMLGASWVGFWAIIVGSMLRFEVCDDTFVTLYCSDRVSLGVQLGGCVLIFYSVWGYSRHKSPGLVFTVQNTEALTWYRSDFLKLRVASTSVNMVQEWLRSAQKGLGCFLPEAEEDSVENLAKHERYGTLIVLKENEVKISGGTSLPKLGDVVTLLEEDEPAKWRVAAETRDGGVRLVADRDERAALFFGDVGDERGGGAWEEAPTTPIREIERVRDLEELEGLREEKILLEDALHSNGNELVTLREALRTQTLKLIHTQGEHVSRLQDAAHASFAQKTFPPVSLPPTPPPEEIFVETPPSLPVSNPPSLASSFDQR